MGGWKGAKSISQTRSCLSTYTSMARLGQGSLWCGWVGGWVGGWRRRRRGLSVWVGMEEEEEKEKEKDGKG